jgi:hypothetical protein
MWVYKQTTGEIFDPQGNLVGVGYSGYGDCMNRPSKQDVPHLGPICRGDYEIEKPAITHHSLGPVVLILIPYPTNVMYGRSLMRIHGVSKDNPKTPEDESKLSSHGCICLARWIRELIAESEDSLLRVIL